MNADNSYFEEVAKAGRKDGDVAKGRRFVMTLLLLIGGIICVVALSVVGASHMLFEHVSCRIAEGTVDGAWLHARSIAGELRDRADRTGDTTSQLIAKNPDEVLKQIRIWANEDSTILYGGVLSPEGVMLIHTAQTQEGIRVKKDGVPVSDISPRVRAFPEGRSGFDEYVYEVRVPLDAGESNGYDLVIGMSRARIDEHVTKVNRDIRAKMSFVAIIGAAIILLPSGALWWLLRRHAAVKRQAETVAHMATIGQLASGLAHEIRNPLNAVRFNLKILEENAERLDNDATSGYVEVAKRAAAEVARVDGLLAEYLDFARPQREQRESLDVNAVVHEVVRFIEHECQRHKIAVVLNLTDDATAVLADRHRIKQALLNLLLNAQQELRETGGSIVITSVINHDRVFLTIADDGSGVDKENQQRVFEPFWTNREDGVGLGLAITRQIVEEHDGMISCETSSQGGAVFTIALPHARKGKTTLESERSPV